MTQQKTVLLVDDDPVMLEFASGILEELGWIVRPADSVAAASIQLKPPVDALITDIVLADGNGWVLADLVKTVHRKAVVVYATGSLDEARRIQNRQAGIIHGELITKPYTVESLRAALGEGTVP